MEQTILNAENGEVPLPRSGHRIVAYDGNVYCFGGYIQFPDRLVVKGEIWQYNLISNRWKQLNFHNLSFHLAASHSVCSFGHTVIIHGGTGTNFGKFIDNSLSVVDLRSLTSCTLSCAPKDNISRNIPLPTYGHTLTFANVNGEPYLYKIGGAMGATYTMNVYRYSLNKKVWERIYHSGDPTNLHPDERYRHDTILYKAKLYVVAGGNESETYTLWPMPVFDLATNKWSFIEFSGTKPAPFRYQSSILVDHDIYVVGGIKYADQTINSEIFRLDLERLECHLVGLQQSPAYFHDIVYIPQLDELYSFGGTNCMNPVTRTNELHRFRLHRRPLALLESAWDKLLDLLGSTELHLFSVQHHVVTSKTDSQDALDYICDVLQPIHTILKLTRAFNLLDTSLSPIRVPCLHITIFRVSAVVSLIMHGFQLGLHTVQSLENYTDVICALEQIKSGCKIALTTLMSCLWERFRSHTHEQPHGDNDQIVRVEPGSLESGTVVRTLSHRSIKPHTRLPIFNSLDSLYYTLLLYFLNVPECLIRRLPDALDYLRCVAAIVKLLTYSRSEEFR